MVAGFLWHPRVQFYLASFAFPLLIFLSSVQVFYVRNLMPVLPFAALWAAVGGVWLWRWGAAHRPALRPSWQAGLAGIGIVLLLFGPVREAFALGWALGRHQDTRTEAVQWLLRHVPPGERVAFELELAWFLPTLDRLPFRVEFTTRDTGRSWYAKNHIAVAVVSDKNPLRWHPVAVFTRPPYLPTPAEEATFLPDTYPIIDPKILVVSFTAP